MNVTIPLLGLTTHGGNRVLIQVANAVAAEGHECAIVTTRTSADCPFVVDPRVAIERHGPRAGHKLLRWFYLLIYLGWRMREPKLVLANHFLTAIPARMAAALWGTRVLYLVQGIEYRAYPVPWRRIAEGICRWTWRSGSIIAANPHLDDELRRLGVRSSFVLHLGVDPVFLTSPAVEGKEKPFDVVCMLRREHYKRPDRLLAVVDELRRRGRTVLCVCPDAEFAALHHDAFTRMVRPESDQALIAHYDSARIFLLTSEYEGFALPPLECMARGIPSVMFECGGPSVYARHDENCMMVADARIDTAVETVIALLADDQRYARLSAQARATAARYDMSDAVKLLVQQMVSTTGECRR